MSETSVLKDIMAEKDPQKRVELEKGLSYNNMKILDTLSKFEYHLKNHNSICVGVSGGSDSNVIVHIIATYFREYLPKVHFVFSNTGLEYKATLRHLDFMEKHYGICLDRIRGESVVTVVRRDGVPVLSKVFSHTIEYAEKGSQWAIDRVNGLDKGSSPMFAFSEKQQALAKELIKRNIKVSDKCCTYSKKNPFHKYMRGIKADLSISGERRAEGGQRALRHKGCFESGDSHDKFMPLFLWDDKLKDYYKREENIIYSDCYEVWGMKRTGCVGCPFNSRVGEDLKMIKRYEPNLYKACMNVFGESYRLMDKFEIHRRKIFDEQITFDEVIK